MEWQDLEMNGMVLLLKKASRFEKKYNNEKNITNFFIIDYIA